MEALIVRLEKATGPDRELANDVLLACDWTLDERGADPVNPFLVWNPPDGGDDFRDGDQPDPTASVDAALTLVPDLTWLEIETGTQIKGNNFDWPIVACGSQQTGNAIWKGQAATFALTLCIAALRARAATSVE